jgi:hypothetical protein
MPAAFNALGMSAVGVPGPFSPALTLAMPEKASASSPTVMP